LLAVLTLPVCLCAEDPFLEIDTGGPTAPVHTILFTSDSRYLISAGEDKVARKWDLATGKTIQAIRGQIEPGNPGKIYAAAVSKKYLALAGYLTDNAIRIHDATTGELQTTLKGHGDTVTCLAFSPDGAYLASGDSGGIILLWDLSKMALAKRLTGHSAWVNSVAFSIDGRRLVSASFDKTLGLWEVPKGKLIKQLVGHTDKVVSAAFSPDGRLLASISPDGTLRLWNPDTGKPAKVIEHVVNPANIVFTPDGQGILLTWLSGGHRVTGIFAIQSGAMTPFPGLDRAIEAAAIAPDGRTAATAVDESHEIDLWDLSTGKPIRKLAGQGRPVWSVAFSKDGRAVFFGNSRSPQTQRSLNNQGPLESLMWLNRKEGDHRLEVDWETSAAKTIEAGAKTAEEQFDNEALRVRDGPHGEPQAVLQLMRGSQIVREFPRDKSNGYRHLCYTFTQDGRIVSGGVAGQLSIYTDSGGKPLDFIGHTGTVWSLAVSPDNRTLVSGSEDQTVRLWDIATRRNLLTLFVTGDQQWVAWTPEGYFASSLYGDKYVGWHLNQGEDKNAKFWTAERFRSQFDRPDIVSQYLKDRDIGQAVLVANRQLGKPEAEPITPAQVAAIAPPEVHLQAPDDDNTTVKGETYSVRASAYSANLPVTQASVLVNGRLAAGHVDIVKTTPHSQEVRQEVTLDPGDNTITVKAGNVKGVSGQSEIKHVRYVVADPDKIRKPDLIVLAIGVSKYKQAAISLAFADNDAREIERLFKSQANGRVFDSVQSELLINEQADREHVLKAIGRFRKAGHPGDMRVLFIAGHGERRGTENKYYFCPYNHDEDDAVPPDTYDIPWSVLMDSFKETEGKAVLMVDTCHAAAIAGAGRRGLQPVNFDNVLQELKGASGVVVFAASTGSESSIEDKEWQHGAFTKAVIDALTGKVAGTNGVVRTDDLDSWVRKEVPKITNNAQHALAFYIPPDELLPFPIFSLKGPETRK